MSASSQQAAALVLPCLELAGQGLLANDGQVLMQLEKRCRH